MKITNRTRTEPSFLSDAGRRLKTLSKALLNIFSFSLADERIALRKCVAVHLDSGGISIAYGSKFFSRLGIAGTRHIPSEEGKYPSAEACASAVYLVLNELKALDADVTLIVPKAWTIVKTADFPLVVKEKLSDVISFELDRITPLSAEKAYYDYQIIREDKNRLQIILAAVKAETLDPYLQSLRQRGVKVQRVIVSLSALGALSHAVQGGDTTLFMDVRPGAYEGGLIDRGRLTDYFNSRFPSAAEAEKDKAAIVAAELNPLITALRREGKMPAVVVNGSSAEWTLLSSALSAPVLYLGEEERQSRFLQGERAIHFTAIGGVLASLLTRLRGLNILEKGVHRPARTPVTLTVFLFAALAALGVFSLVASLQIETRRVEAIDREITARSAEVKQIETLKNSVAAIEKEIDAIDRFKISRPVVLDLLKELTQILPNNAWLTRVHTTDTTVNIEGYAASATGILSKLEASPYFKKVEFASPTFRDARMNAERFVFKMEIEGLPEGKGKDEKR